jgi:hypothetical protein
VVYDRGPGIVVTHAKTSEGGLASLWLIGIWSRLKLYGAVVPTLAASLAASQGE